MSRKDTIIIALLINAGLLALLFMLAINTDDEKISENQLASNQPIAENVFPSQANQNSYVYNSTNSTDEVDTFLKDIASEDTSQPILLDEEGSFFENEKETPLVVLPATPSSKPEIVRISDEKVTEETKFVEVTVKRGDALEKIARSNGTTIEAIKKMNNLTSTKLSIGQILRIPLTKKESSETAKNSSVNNQQQIVNAPKPTSVKTTLASSAASTVNPNPSKLVASSAPNSKSLNTPPAPPPLPPSPKIADNGDEATYYIIKNGDNPWKISKQFNVPFDELLKLNNLNEEKARNLKAGDRIRVR